MAGVVTAFGRELVPKHRQSTSKLAAVPRSESIKVLKKRVTELARVGLRASSSREPETHLPCAAKELQGLLHILLRLSDLGRT